MIELDGNIGGGQVLRTALAIAALQGKPIHIYNIRGAREQPGLRPQQRAVVDCLAELTDGSVSSTAIGTTELTFSPTAICTGEFEIDIGTAGSVFLLCDAILPLATSIDAPLTVHITGGTDVKWAPPSTTYRSVKLPILRRYGLNAEVIIERHGFYPAGGGQVTLRLLPSTMTEIDVGPREQVRSVSIEAVVGKKLRDALVAERHVAAVEDCLDHLQLSAEDRSSRYVSSDSPGSVVSATLDTGAHMAGFDAIGERGVPAEQISQRVCDAINMFLDSSAAIDSHMADQLLIWLAIAGGHLTIPQATDHVQSQLAVLETFGYAFEQVVNLSTLDIITPEDDN